jgi:hypothetical protein
MTGTRDAALSIARRAGNEVQIAPWRGRSAESISDRGNLLREAPVTGSRGVVPTGPQHSSPRHHVYLPKSSSLFTCVS